VIRGGGRPDGPDRPQEPAPPWVWG